MMRTLTFIVERITGRDGAEKLRSALASEPGVDEVDVSFETGRVRIQFDTGKTSENRLFDAVQKAGYGVPGSCP